MIQSDTFGIFPRNSSDQSAIKFLVQTGLLGLLLLTSACQFPGRTVTTSPAPDNTAALLPGPTVAAQTNQLANRSQPQRAGDAVSALGSDELIAADLVNAIVQIDKLHPSRITLQMDDRPINFSATLKFVLEQAGYDFNSYSSGSRHRLVSVKLKDTDRSENGVYRRYQVNVGSAKFRREYLIQTQGVSPSSDLLVKGVDASRIVLNEDIFNNNARPVVVATALGARSNGQQAVASVAEPLPTLPVPTAVKENNITEPPALATAAAISPQKDHGHDHDHSGRESFTLKKNLFQLGHSNFAEFTENFTNVKSQVLVFANDSLKLGRRNKAAVLEFAQPFIEESDVISIIGCSHGRTSIANGNVVLATGRTQRVKEAFLIAGIAEDRILDEGCWSATDKVPANHPRRGVTVTLKRERRNG